MQLFAAILALVTSCATTLVVAQEGANETICADPVAAIVANLDCLEQEDPECASAGYNQQNFKKVHNGNWTSEESLDRSVGWWTRAFLFVDLSFEYDNLANISPNLASLRYVETSLLTSGVDLGLPPSTTYPFGQVYLQKEHALVTVDGNCKMTIWDQIGDNQEQAAVDNAFEDLVAEPSVQCVINPDSCGEETLSPSGAPSPTSSLLFPLLVSIPLWKKL